MTYTRAQAVARAMKSTTYPIGMCYRWTREQFGLPAVGDRDGDGDADAVDGWKAAQHRHPGDRNPPAGVPVFWSGGSRGHGHAAISLGGGKIRSIDAAGAGHVGTVSLGWPESAWGLHYLGWSEDLGGALIPTDTAPEKDPDPVDINRKARDRYLARRREKGQLRPLPLRRGQVNGMGATAKPEVTAAIVLDGAEDADILTLCEVANIDVAKVLGPKWDVAQDTSSPAKAGSAVAVRRSRARIKSWRLALGVRAVLAGRRADRMRDRYVMVATIIVDGHDQRRRWQYKVAAGHAPPKRNWSPWWGAWMRAVRLVLAHDIGADWNRAKAAVQKVFPARIVRMHRGDGFVTRPFIPSTPVTTRDVGGDHPAVYSTYWPIKKETR